MFQGATIDDKGNFNYKDFAQVLKHGEWREDSNLILHHY